MPEWKPIDTAPRDGTLCILRFRDAIGYYQSNHAHFLHDDGHWYLVDPPTQLKAAPVAWDYF